MGVRSRAVRSVCERPERPGGPLLFVFAKEPTPGAVKTRLCPPLTPAQAAECQRAFTLDLVRRLGGGSSPLRSAGVRTCLAATPDGDAPQLREIARRSGVELVWQGAGDLGVRMERALRRGCAEAGAAVVIGSDLPDLPLTRIEEAADAVRRGEVVIGPCPDGGYYLIGCQASVPPVFRLEARWGGAGVLAQTLKQLDRLQRGYHVLRPWEDVDGPEALARIAHRLKSSRALRRELSETSRVLTRIPELPELPVPPKSGGKGAPV